MFFLRNNIDGFYGASIPICPFIISCMKVFAALSVECANTMIIVDANSTTDVIMGFIALEIIS